MLLLPNLYGNILTNIACGLVGGPGITSGINYGLKHAVFETVSSTVLLLCCQSKNILNCCFQGTRNTGKSVSGKDIANPIAMINASADLLEYLKLDDQAEIVRESIYKAINVEKLHTQDMGGTASTSNVVDFIIDDVKTQTHIKAYQSIN